MVVDDEEKANILNTFFSTVFTVENEMLGEIPRNNENPILRVTNLTQEEVRNRLNKIKIDKSPGPDGIHPRVLRELSNVIDKPLFLIFSDSIVTGSVPQDWRIANVVPIFKKGSKSEPGNYRPEVQKRFPDGVPLLDPIDDMGIKDPGLKKVIQKTEAFEHRMYSHPLNNDPNLESAYKLCEKKAQIAVDIRTARRELKKARTVLQMDELKCRKRVLRRMGFASSSDVIEMKGRVACEISSADELLLTEMMFNGLFNDLTAEQATALLSCFVFQENSSEMPKLTEQLAGPLRQMQETARRIAKVSAEAKLEIDEETYLGTFRPNLMDVVYTWANGATFAQICKMTDVFEGSIIRCMRRLEELLRQMCQAAKAIGNTELENKFAEDGFLTAIDFEAG
ncbi:unnamed protein product [Ranitomeya imitator]|uniref:ATP-dependent RNA helicase Ski2/MTR4 C-terminal domain-containing protein n=1 Tax=Ranitomeya imitator TaxID=111125 RepID=A0ABN9LHF7_9NEOB|nr:unnamed protein product [Ranitomeya imitator]